MKTKNIFILFILFSVIVGFQSCREDELDYDNSVFVDEDDLDPSSFTYVFDTWLDSTFLEPYNLDFIYKLQDVSTNVNYNMVPARLKEAKEMAVLMKYLWFDAYTAVAKSDNFLKENSPRIIALVGNEAYNTSGNADPALSEGGIKISLFDINNLKISTSDQIKAANSKYFRVIHKVFVNILNQKKLYPRAFDDISAGDYDAMQWYDSRRTRFYAHERGFVSNYAMSQPRTDFAETIAYYICQDQAWWKEAEEAAEKAENTTDIKALINLKAKVAVCKKWMLEEWDIDLDELRDEINERQKHVNEIIAEHDFLFN